MFSLSEITWACEQLSQLALGFFVVHVAGRCYGIRKPDASMLGVSFDQVDKRIARRGSHNPPFPMNAAAADVAYSFRRAIYDESGEGERFFGMSVPHFQRQSLRTMSNGSAMKNSMTVATCCNLKMRMR